MKLFQTERGEQAYKKLMEQVEENTTDKLQIIADNFAGKKNAMERAFQKIGVLGSKFNEQCEALSKAQEIDRQERLLMVQAQVIANTTIDV